MERKKIVAISIISILLAAVLLVSATLRVSVKNSKDAIVLDAENLRAIEYGEFKEGDEKVKDCDYVQFSAFFLKDINNDSYTEKIKGTCKEIGQTDTLYMDINVLTQGSLKNGRITLNAQNFTWKTSIVMNNMVDGNYVGETSSIKLKNEISNGNQTLLEGKISSKIGNNINDYCRVNSITLTGTYVDDDGYETPISKTIDLTVDWYGTTKTTVSTGNQKKDIDTILKDDKVVIKFNTTVSDTARQLLLKKQEAKITIPDLNGYSAEDVKVTGSKNYIYDKDSGILTITREATLDENGKITNSVARSNTDTIEIIYPIEAYQTIGENSLVLNIPIEGYNEGYNNTYREFENPHKSSAKGILTVTYEEPPTGEIWNIYTTVGTYVSSSRYEISKEIPTKIYNGNVYEDETTIYPVKWEVRIGDYTAIDKLTLEEEKSDEFVDGNISMKEYATTTGVYFSNASNILGDDGWIKLYDAETEELLGEFKSDNWEQYTEKNPYEVNVKSIKVQTSKPIINSYFYVYQIKEMDDELITEKFKEDQFEQLEYIYTYLKGTIEAPNGVKYDNGSTTASLSKSAFAYYEMPYSVAGITVTPDQITNQETKNVKFVVKTQSSNFMQKKWINGIFLIELPEDIIKVNLNSVEASNEKVEIVSSESFEENGKHYIKIYTANEEELLYNITINVSLTANPSKPTETQTVKLYYYNENCDNYSSKKEDIYDIDSDGKKDDKVGYNITSLSIVSPSGLATVEYITEYDEFESITIAPNIAEIERADEKRKATINVSLVNNYSRTISEIVILGKTPFKGNTYVLNEESLNSDYTANMTGPISVPENLKDIVTVYYSTKEKPAKDLKEPTNNWQTEDKITNWSAIRTYLIDFGNYRLSKGEDALFTYEVEVPAGEGCNNVTYSDHAVYYSLDTESGKYLTQTEPNKVGIQVIKKYSMQLTKNKKANSNTLVQGAVYKLTTTDLEGNVITKTATTDENGILTFKGMYAENEYYLKEISSPSDYILSTDEIKFKIELDESGKLVFKKLSGEFKEEPEVTFDDNGNYLVKAKVEDEAKYTIIINKTGENKTPLKNVRFNLKGNGIGDKTYKTDKNGIIKLEGLYPNEQYELKEISADGYYLDGEVKTFTVVRNANGELEIQTTDAQLKNATIKEETGIAQAEVTLNIENEKIPTYSLQILKVEESEDEEEELTPLVGAKFRLTSEDLKTQKEYTTDKKGCIDISDLYQYVSGKYISGWYTLQEIKAPDGYSNYTEEIKFRVENTAEEGLKITIENQDDLKSVKSIKTDSNTVKLVIQDKPVFKITKIDAESEKPLANAKFAIYELDENGTEIGPAEDVNGNIVGEKNEKNQYVVTTNEKGEISLPLRGGIYKIVEIEPPDGYISINNNQIVKVAGNVIEEIETEDDGQEIIQINYIEDLVELSEKVNSGDTYEGKTVRLMRDLDFTDSASYEKNVVDESLTKAGNGSGFTPIGNKEHVFSGTFDGQENEIRNIYINININIDETSSSYVGLFGYVSNGKIKNLGITGEINNINSGSNGGTRKTNYTGGIAGRVENSSIINCYNTASISSTAWTSGYSSWPQIYSNNSYSYTGGIVGYLSGISSINNCYNIGDISSIAYTIEGYGNNSSSVAGGIVGYASGLSGGNISISNCYNDGDISSESRGSNCSKVNPTYSGSRAGGIVGYGEIYTSISNCYNTGAISSSSYLDVSMRVSGDDYQCGNTSYAGGIAGVITGTSSSISNCYNTGDISSYCDFGDEWGAYSSYAGGIAGSSSSSISNCYNTGEITGNTSGRDCSSSSSYHISTSNAGGIAGNSSGSISNCYNTKRISSSSNSRSNAGGIAGTSSSFISNCYNIGEAISNGYRYSYGGGVVGYTSSNIKNCYNAGTISSSTSYYSGDSYAGGIVGYIERSSSIRNCYNTGDISSGNTSGSNNSSRAGGITGYGSNIGNCYYLDSINIVANIDPNNKNPRIC